MVLSSTKLSLAAASFVVAMGGAVAYAEETHIRLENERYLVEVSREHGLITRLLDKQGKLELLQEPRLADNYRFTLPIRGQAAWQATEANYILGRDQRLSAHEVRDGALTLKWDGPLTSVLGKPHDVSAMMTIQLAGDDVRFAFRIANATQLEIGEVFYPILGGSLGLGDTPGVRRQTELVVPGIPDVRSAKIFHTFANMSWLGVIGPEQFHSYPDSLSMPWMELSQTAAGRSLYFGAHDPVLRYKVIHLEMLPGISGARADGNWPKAEELNALPAGVKMCFVHFPYQPAGQAFKAAPVVLRFHDGDWREGARIYGDWFASQHDLREARRNWLAQTPAFQQVGRVPFKDLPQWASRGMAAGVRALLLADWKVGGQDNGVPRFEPDPRLGSREEFTDALRKCREMGVKVSVVVNLPPAGMLDDGYSNELHRYACVDRWGIVNTIAGWPQGSPVTGGFGGEERRCRLNPAHPGMRKSLTTQILALAELGVDGIELKDFFARPLDFNPTVGLTADCASWTGGLQCAQEIVVACRRVNPEFSLSFDAAWDGVLSVSSVGSTDARDASALRVAFACWQPTFTVADEDSVGIISDAVRYGGRLRVAPANGRPMGGPEMEGVAGYLCSTTAVRQVLRRTLIDGDRLAVGSLMADGKATSSVFRDRAGGERTAVLVNPGFQPIEVQVSGFREPGVKPMGLWQPGEGAKAVSLPTRVTIPGRQYAVLTEEPAVDRLNTVPRWKGKARDERTVFEIQSADDLHGWTLEGQAFAVGPLPGLNPRPTLNSLARAGEAATGSALSPSFLVEPAFDRMEIVLQGGWSRKVNGAETLAVRLVDAAGGSLLEQVLPPGNHELVTVSIKLEKLRGRTIRLQMVDNSTASSFAWIGLRRVTLIGPPRGDVAR